MANQLSTGGRDALKRHAHLARAVTTRKEKKEKRRTKEKQ